MPKLVFARDQRGHVTHVSRVPSGLACRCCCIDCGEPLIARKGAIREHHFSHTSGQEHDYSWASHLHAYAKQLIVDEGGLVVPLHVEAARHLGLSVGDMSARLRAGAAPVQTEVQMGRLRPDLVLHLGDRDMPVALEVWVTHACDAAKVAQFERQRLAALEIDLSGYPPHLFDAVEVEEMVPRGTRNKE